MKDSERRLLNVINVHGHSPRRVRKACRNVARRLGIDKQYVQDVVARVFVAYSLDGTVLHLTYCGAVQGMPSCFWRSS